MDLIQILILGLVQGITEWLPISSKTLSAYAYLMMGGEQAHTIYILLYLHLGTILAAIIYFRKQLVELAQKTIVLRKVDDFKNSHAGFYIAALAGTGIVGVPLLLLQKLLFETLDATVLFGVMGLGLLITAYLLHSQHGKIHERKIEAAGVISGLFTGLMQGLSVLPGVSRSGTTTTALAWQKFEPSAIFELSFILSIPTVLAAELLFYLLDANFAGFDLVEGTLLCLSSFFFGYLTIDLLIKFAKKFNLAIVAAVFGLLMVATAVLQIS